LEPRAKLEMMSCDVTSTLAQVSFRLNPLRHSKLALKDDFFHFHGTRVGEIHEILMLMLMLMLVSNADADANSETLVKLLKVAAVL
jgi:hypothetical protein